MRDQRKPFKSYPLFSSSFPNTSATLTYKHYGLIALFSALLYINTINADFAYDDSRAIKSNSDLLPTTPWFNLLTNDFWGTPLTHSGSHKSYRPLTVASFRLNYYLHSLSPTGYHVVNVALYTLSSLLFAHLSTYLFISDTISCLIASLIYTSHPVHVESVAGIVGRADLLATIFFTLSLIAYIRFCHLKDYTHFQSPSGSPSLNMITYAHLYVSLVAATCSMLSKEYGITVLGVAAVYHLAIHFRCASYRSLKNIKLLFTQDTYSGLREGLAHLVLTFVTLISFRLYMMGSQVPTFSPADNPTAKSSSRLIRFLTFSYLPCFNFGLLLYPRWLSFDWSMESIKPIKQPTDPRNLITFTFYSILLYLTHQLYKFQTKDLSDSPTSSFPLHLTPEEPGQPRNRRNHHCSGSSYLSNSTATTIKSQFQFDWLHSKCDNHLNATDQWSSSSSTCSSGSNDTGSTNEDAHDSFDSLMLLNHDTLHGSYFTRSAITTMAWSLLIIPFIPATNLLFYVGFVIAERILIIPSMGYALLLTLGINTLRSRVSSADSRDDSQPMSRRRGTTLSKKILSQRSLYLTLGLLVLIFSLRTHRRNEDWRTEEHLYRSGIPINPPKAYGNLANILSSKGLKLEAEMAYRKALTYRFNMADVHYNLGILFQEQGRFHEALQSYTYAVKFRPRLALAYLNMGLVLAKLNRKTEAISVYKHCISLDGSRLKDPRTHEATKVSAAFNLGQLYSDQGEYEKAIEVFKAAIVSMPPHYQPQSLYNMLGESYYRLGRYSEAERWYKQALMSKKDHIPAHLTYAKLLAKWNRPEEAKQWFLKAEMLAPNDSSVYQHYGQFLAEHGQYEEAADCLLKAVQLSPNEYEIVFGAANILREAGRNQEAERFYKEAVRLRPNEVTSHLNLGAMLHVNGKLNEAETSYLAALKLNPNDQLTQTNLAKLRHLLSSKRPIGR